ncbi:MAG: bifunctional nicotinamidase/pyrazinamidase [Bradymonadaceae bacterium]
MEATAQGVAWLLNGATPAVDVPRRFAPQRNVELMDRFDLVVATQDWHPPNHGSFASNNPGAEPGEIRKLDGLDQIMWPDHCVQNTKGAEFVDGLRTERIDEVFQKGTDPKVDSYSGFYDNARRHATRLADYLRDNGVDEVYVVGVATDYCVKFTVLDALSEGFDVSVVVDATRGVNREEGDVDRAIEEMAAAGAKVVESSTSSRQSL